MRIHERLVTDIKTRTTVTIKNAVNFRNRSPQEGPDNLLCENILRHALDSLLWLGMNRNEMTRLTLLGTITTEITDRKFMSKDGLRVQYRVRKTIRSLSSPANIIKPQPTPTHTKSGRELRPKVQSVYSYETETDAPLLPKIIEAWCAEVSALRWETGNAFLVSRLFCYLRQALSRHLMSRHFVIYSVP